MPRTDAQFAALRQATNDKIIAAATSLFARKGFAATSVQEIANAAGISTGLMYRHYASKEDLFGALVEVGAESFAQLAQQFSSDAPPVDLLYSWMGEVIEDLERDSQLAAYTTMMTQAVVMESDHPSVARLIVESNRLEQAVVGLIEKGQADGSFRKGEPRQLAQHLLATITGMAFARMTMEDNYLIPTVEMAFAFLVDEEKRHGTARE